MARKVKTDFDYQEDICRIEGEIDMIETEMSRFRSKWSKIELQSLLTEKRKQLQNANSRYRSYILDKLVEGE